MAQRTAIGLTGDDLTVADVWAVAVEGAPAMLTDVARKKMRAARELVERAAHGSREHTYGVNTGFGRFVNRSIPEELTEELQLRLLRSHACGVGEPYEPEIVRAATLLRANTLAKGNSGARVDTVELLLAFLERGVTPVVPGWRPDLRPGGGGALARLPIRDGTIIACAWSKACVTLSQLVLCGSTWAKMSGWSYITSSALPRATGPCVMNSPKRCHCRQSATQPHSTESSGSYSCSRC